jgi:hypothetical protein
MVMALQAVDGMNEKPVPVPLWPAQIPHLTYAGLEPGRHSGKHGHI